MHGQIKRYKFSKVLKELKITSFHRIIKYTSLTFKDVLEQLLQKTIDIKNVLDAETFWGSIDFTNNITERNKFFYDYNPFFPEHIFKYKYNKKNKQWFIGVTRKSSIYYDYIFSNKEDYIHKDTWWSISLCYRWFKIYFMESKFVVFHTEEDFLIYLDLIEPFKFH